ncbi:MAG: hypothetical protein ABT01_06745 [Clostridium sp. SCN 57-10]|nr:MAG: hypothetical protein ABT01_06745 [Clostridium sp. SCN 57-10]
MNVTIEWLGHSCFRLTGGDSSIILDPYADDMIPGLAPLRAAGDAVFCSHDHDDHGFIGNVTLSGRAPALQVERLVVPHDDCGGAQRGLNRIHIFTLDGARIAHFGDIGVMPDATQLDRLRGLDAAFIPVGGHDTIDAATADTLARAIEPRVVIPMHYRTEGFGFGVIGTLDAFTSLRGDVQYGENNCLTLTDDTPAQTFVPAYCGGDACELPV